MIVLDSCAAVDIVRRTDEGLALRELVMQEEAAISCELVRAEAASVFRKLARTERLGAKLAERYLIEAMALIDDFYSLEDLQPEAFRESIRLDHSVYDMFYFVLARRTGATLLTLDHNLMRLCHDHGVRCVTEEDLVSTQPGMV